MSRTPVSHARNAALYYANDSYAVPSGKINGRRVAGVSFLHGFLRHADVDRFVAVTPSVKEAQDFTDQVAASGRGLRAQTLTPAQLGRGDLARTLYYPAANIAGELWRRQATAPWAYSVCGITHTTATQAVMRGFHDLRAAPQMPWDAVICTSKAVAAATRRNIELADQALMARFGGKAPPLPLLPVIPLGIDTARFTHDPAARAALRGRMGWGEQDVAVVTLSRLVPYGKFDPGPLFIAMQAAQEALGPSRRLHFLACGVYGDAYSRRSFEGLAAALMPGVSYHHLDGADPVARRETLSGGDIFAFPIDNVQETFGLAPVEAMAAGLPVLASDWDGIRDTVTPDCGVLIPTQSVRPAATRPEARAYLSGAMSYGHYGANLSALTVLDMGAMVAGLVALARDPDLRRTMGAAGQARARALFDWSAVIPAYQDLWAEQDRIRQAAAQEGRGPVANPVGPLPMDLFACYPSRAPSDAVSLSAIDGAAVRLEQVFAAREQDQIGRLFERPDTLRRILAEIERAGPITPRDLAARLGWNPLSIERAAAFLRKYGIVTTQNIE